MSHAVQWGHRHVHTYDGTKRRKDETCLCLRRNSACTTVCIQWTTLCLFRNTPGTCEQHEVMLTAAEVLLHTTENNTELPATGCERGQNRFLKWFQKRLGKSVENRSASATKKEAGHAAGEPWGRLCNRVRRGRFAGAQQGCRISLVSVFSYSFEYRSVQIQQQEKKPFCVSYPLILSDFFPLLSQNLNKNRNMLKHH